MDPDNDIVIIDFGIHIPIQFSSPLLILYSAKHLHSPDKQGWY